MSFDLYAAIRCYLAFLNFFLDNPVCLKLQHLFMWIAQSGIKYIICCQTIFLARFSDQTILIDLFIFFSRLLSRYLIHLPFKELKEWQEKGWFKVSTRVKLMCCNNISACIKILCTLIYYCSLFVKDVNSFLITSVAFNSHDPFP